MEHEAILEKLDEMNKRMERIERKLGVVEESCSSMDSHIGFVEGLYTTLKSPLHYVVSRITGYDESLPAAPSSQKRIENGQTQSVIAKQNDTEE